MERDSPDFSALDAFDRALLAEVRVDNQVPARVLAGRVNLSESAVSRRLRHLRKIGAIVADVAIVHPSIVGRPLAIHVLVKLERDNADRIDSFARRLRGRSEVRQAWYVTGESDLLLRLRVAGIEEYETFTREALQTDPNVRSFQTIVALRSLIAAPLEESFRGGRDGPAAAADIGRKTAFDLG